MYTRKLGGKVVGAKLTAAQEKAMHMEIKRQCAEYWRKHQDELVALMLWVLHDTQGWGKKRLRDFFDNFMPALDELLEHYDMGEEDKFWLCSTKLKEIGVDIEAWQSEGEKYIEHESEKKQ